jgi:hypothetical protein
MDQQGDTKVGVYASYWPLGLVICIGSMATIAVSRAGRFLEQRGAAAYLAELAGMLCIYVAAIAFSTKLKGERWEVSQRNAVRFGLLSALVETTSIVLENLAPALFSHAAVSISFMLVTFLIWAVAAIWTPCTSAPWKSGLLAAVESAGICMLIAVTIGFPIELFLRPPDPAIVATWGEYQRSGWTNARLFALANTLDSGFTHLLLAPFVACIFGVVALLIRRVFSLSSRELAAK